MSLIEWKDDDLSVGIDIIDMQHQTIVSNINRLSDCILNNESSEIIKMHFEKLIDYAQFHFDTEEAYFERLLFNDLKMHKLQHKHLLEQLVAESQKEITLTTLEFLIDWFVIHVQCEDMKLRQVNFD